MLDEEAVDLLNGYNQWARDQMGKEPDTSPQAFLEYRAMAGAQERLTAIAGLADKALEALASGESDHATLKRVLAQMKTEAG